jgi:hypothetical protein
MGEMEGVNHNRRQRGYGARDKDEIINSIIKLHIKGYSQVDLYLSSVKEICIIGKEIYKYGDIKLNRKYEKFSSLMI